MTESLKKLLIKKLAKQEKQKKNRAKIWQEKTQWGWNLKKKSQTKKIAIKITRTKLERLKNQWGWN
jgi:deoxyinosine 3'endonuclease (endonuclease V)